MLQVYDITVKATGAEFPVSAPGKFIYYLNGSAGGADSTLKIRAGNTAQSFLLKPGQAMRLSDAEKPIDTFYLKNYAGTADILGQVLVGDGDFNDNRISGSVEVIDGGKNRTSSGSAMIAYGYFAGQASLFTHGQLWNPSNSGKNIFVEQITFFSTGTVANGIAIKEYDVAQTTLISAGKAKRLGNPDSLAQVRAGVNAAQLGLSTIAALDKALKNFKFTEPLQIPPGYGIQLINATLGEDLGAGFEYFEENV